VQGDAAHTGARSEAPAPPYATAWIGELEVPSGQRLSAPVLAGDTAVVASPSALAAFSLSDGGSVWTLERDGAPVAPAIASVDGSDVVVWTNGRGPDTASVDAVDIETGTSVWDAPIELDDESKSGVGVDGTHAFVGDEGGTLSAIDVAQGTVTWTASTGGSLAGPVAAADGIVVAVVAASDANRSARVVAFDEATGKVRWDVTPDATASFGSLPTIADGAVVVAFPDGEVLGLSTADGSESWHDRIPALVSPFVGPAVAGRSFVFADSNGGVHLLTPGDGPSWIYEFNEPILRASPVVAGDTVVVGHEDGSIGAVSLRTGHLVFRSPSPDAAVGGLGLTSDLVVVSRGGGGGTELVALRSDPDGSLLDEASPTDPVPAELAAGLGLAVAVAAAIFVPGRAASRRIAIVDPSSEPGDADADGDDG
jgi:outer membrane protein assembly factor BamB